MNALQRKVLVGTAVVVAAMVLFPPYQITNYQGATIRAGYAFLFDLPEYVSSMGGKIASSVNAETLLLQIFGAIVASVLIFLAAGGKHEA